MTSAAVIARLVLAAIFAAAAAGKLIDYAGTREAVLQFGAPRLVAPVLAFLFPAVELAAATLLLIAPTASAGAITSLALLGVFSAVIASNLARGRRPDCHCFGALHSAPAGPGVLARNAALVGLAALVLVVGGHSSATGWVDVVPSAIWLAVIAGLAVALIGLLQAHGRLLLRAEALERAIAEAGATPTLDVIAPRAGRAPGSLAPAFELSAVDGDQVSLRGLLTPGRPLLLVFASPSCGPCTALMPTVARWQREHADELTVAVLSDGEPRHVRAEQEELGLERVLHDEGSSVYELYRADGTPGAALIAPDGTVASWVASGQPAIERLVAGVIDTLGLPLGAPAPAAELATLDGDTVMLGGVDETLLLFWNPDCGYCRQMHSEILAWERGTDRPRLIVVSSGDAERTREDGFASPVVLDPDSGLARAFGSAGTPSAVRLDAEGRVASAIATGTPSVLTLIEAREAVPA
ncbi:MAG: MauE/DoxX family redox-associated membrane protein [Solirubrobacteraceae bacterium]